MTMYEYKKITRSASALQESEFLQSEI